MLDAPLVLAELITLLLGLPVAYLAYHGYRRTGRSAMLYVAAGFVCIGAGATCEGVIRLAFDASLPSAGFVQATAVSSGMVLVSLTR